MLELNLLLMNQNPHNIIASIGNDIVLYQLTLEDQKFEDIAENDGAGDGIPDVNNTGTDFEDQINLDGGIYTSRYGIEETQGGQNTTLFTTGDQVKDASIPFKFATIESAGALGDGIEHTSRIKLKFADTDNNSINFMSLVKLLRVRVLEFRQLLRHGTRQIEL